MSDWPGTNGGGWLRDRWLRCPPSVWKPSPSSGNHYGDMGAPWVSKCSFNRTMHQQRAFHLAPLKTSKTGPSLIPFHLPLPYHYLPEHHAPSNRCPMGGPVVDRGLLRSPRYVAALIGSKSRRIRVQIGNNWHGCAASCLSLTPTQEPPPLLLPVQIASCCSLAAPLRRHLPLQAALTRWVSAGTRQRQTPGQKLPLLSARPLARLPMALTISLCPACLKTHHLLH